MPDITYTVSANFLSRARAVVKFEQPNLVGQPDATVNAVARERAKVQIIEWLVRTERQMAAQTAAGAVTTPGTGDID